MPHPAAHDAPMELVSVNVGLPREVAWRGRTVVTAIDKQPARGRIPVTRLNLAGDRQADLSVHGGPDKAVYCYPFEHYGYWRRELPSGVLVPGAFGENFTTRGLLEDAVFIGDRFRAGSAEFIVTQPRLPCYKLGVRFRSDAMVRRFLASRRTGFYLAVVREGDVAAGDRIEWTARDPNAIPVSEITRLYVVKRYGPADWESVRNVLRLPALPASWRDYFAERIAAPPVPLNRRAAGATRSCL